MLLPQPAARSAALPRARPDSPRPSRAARAARAALAAALALAPAALADEANFDSRSEGFRDEEYRENDITFYGLSVHLGDEPGDNIFTIERAVVGLAGQPGFTPDNCLGFGGYSPGDGAGFSRMGEFSIAVEDPRTSASMHLYDMGPNAPGTFVVLEAYLGQTLVNSVTVPIDEPAGLHHSHLTLGGPAFDRLRLRVGPTDQDAIVALVDSVRIDDAPPCPADCSGDGGLSVDDFTCFRARFLAGHDAADCDGDGALGVSDFACFRAAFLAGCP